jgi:two-component system phosphate regulon response regulator PhoB
MPKPAILVVDDEADILELVSYNLEREGFRVHCVSTGEDALAAARREPPDLAVLDLMLPGVDGLEVCRRLKADARTRPISIIMLTAKGEDADIVAGLELGAEDYITKPFSPRVLVARVRAVLRRRQAEAAPESGLVRAHEVAIDLARHEARVEDRPIDLTPSEFNILHFLARRPGLVFTRGQIIDGVKGSDYPVTERSVDVQIVSLRRKLGAAGRYIETVRGVGYRFSD